MPMVAGIQLGPRVNIDIMAPRVASGREQHQRKSFRIEATLHSSILAVSIQQPLQIDSHYRSITNDKITGQCSVMLCLICRKPLGSFTHRYTSRYSLTFAIYASFPRLFQRIRSSSLRYLHALSFDDGHGKCRSPVRCWMM